MRNILLLVALLAAVLSMGAKAAVKSTVLDAVEDSFVVTDASTEEDPEGLRTQTFGNLEFIRVWYASKVRKEEQLISVALVKFDLRPLAGREIQSATLQLFAVRADLAQPARLVDVSLVQGPWNEREVNFTNRPPWTPSPVSTAAVFGAGPWYSWDVTLSADSALRQKQDLTLSYALGLRTVEDKKEEQVVFASREAGRNAPRLVVTYVATPAVIAVIAWYIWVAIVAGGVVLAFLAAWWLFRRGPSAPRPGRGPTANATLATGGPGSAPPGPTPPTAGAGPGQELAPRRRGGRPTGADGTPPPGGAQP